MPRTPSKSGRPHRADAAARTTAADVLTLAEAAAYPRTSEEDVVRLVREQGLPGRTVGDGWRFLKAAVQEWLATPPPSTAAGVFWQAQFGALRGDPYLEDLLRDVYKRRGRPEAEER